MYQLDLAKIIDKTCERIYFLENSDICSKCEERFWLEELTEICEYIFVCEDCFVTEIN